MSVTITRVTKTNFWLHEVSFESSLYISMFVFCLTILLLKTLNVITLLLSNYKLQADCRYSKCSN